MDGIILSFFTQEDLDQERERAKRDAFRDVQDCLGEEVQSEMISQFKQKLQAQHANTLFQMEAKVETYVSDIQKGMSELDKGNKKFNSLLKDFELVKQETENGGPQIEEFTMISQLSNILEHSTDVYNYLEKFQAVHITIEEVSNYFQENPKCLSIEVFKAIEHLIEFEKEVSNETHEKERIKQRFKVVHDCRDSLLSNAIEIVSTSFVEGGESFDVDVLTRANWILIASGNREIIINTLKNTVRSQIYQIAEDAPLQDVLKSLSGIFEDLPEKLELITPTLPPEINALSVISTFTNHEISQRIRDMDEALGENPFKISEVLKWLFEYSRSLKMMLGLESSAELNEHVLILEKRFVDCLPYEFNNMNRRIIDMMKDDVTTSRNGEWHTHAPLDMVKAFVDADKIAVGSHLNHIRQDIHDALVSEFERALIRIGDKMSTFQWAVAAANDTIVFVTAIENCSNDHPELLNSTNTRRLKLACSRLQKRCITVVFDQMMKEITFEDSYDLKNDFSSKAELLRDLLDQANQHMGITLRNRFHRHFSKAIVAYYMVSYIWKSNHLPGGVVFDNQEQLEKKLQSDLEYFEDLFSLMNEECADMSLAGLKGFVYLLTDSYDHLYISQDTIVKRFPDFSSSIAFEILQKRKDFPKLGNNEYIVELGKAEAQPQRDDIYVTRAYESIPPDNKKKFGKKFLSKKYRFTLALDCPVEDVLRKKAVTTNLRIYLKPEVEGGFDEAYYLSGLMFCYLLKSWEASGGTKRYFAEKKN